MKSHEQTTINADLKWLGTLGKVEPMNGDRRYRLVFASGLVVFAKFQGFKTLTVLVNCKNQKSPAVREFDYMPMEDTSEVATFLRSFAECQSLAPLAIASTITYSNGP